jgi:hypothetical protein
VSALGSVIQNSTELSENNVDSVTEEEEAAIASLKRVAKRWPKTLRLIHSGCAGTTLYVCRANPAVDGDLNRLEVLTTVNGFNADSMA